MINLQKIALKKSGIYVPENYMNNEETLIPGPKVFQFNEELIALGYILEKNVLLSLKESFVDDFGKNVLQAIAEQDFNCQERKWRPFYKNFPNELIDKSEEEMRYDQYLHYSYGWLPEYEEQESLAVLEKAKSLIYAQKLKALSKKDIEDIYKRLLELNTSITPIDQMNIITLLKKEWDIIPESSIPFKENLALVVSTLGKGGVKYCSTITDVLRSAVYLCEINDVTLKLPPKRINGRENTQRENYKFRKISRAIRRTILEMFEKYCELKRPSMDDIKKHRNYFIKLGEYVHPGEYKYQYPHAFELFDTARNKKIASFGTKLHEAYKNSMIDVIEILSKRPGEFMRRFDSLYRREGGKYKSRVLNAFIDLEHVSTKVILEFIEYIKTRETDRPRTLLNRKNNTSINLPKLDTLDPRDIKDIKEYSLILLCENYKKQESLVGKTAVIFDDVNEIALPKDMRSLSNSGKIPITRGSSINIPGDVKKVRLFHHWVDTDGSMDLDLAATFLSNDLEVTMNVGWDSGHRCFSDDGKNMIISFSGDVRHTVGNCAEYIDIDIDECVKKGFNYVCADVCDYGNDGFNNINSYGGICAIDEVATGNNLSWVPTNNVIFSFKPETEGTNIFSMILDLKERKVIIIDENISGMPIGSYNNPMKKNILRKYIDPVMKTRDIFILNMKSRGANIMSEEEFLGLENPDMENFIVYRKEDLLNDYSLFKTIFEG